MKGEDMGNLVDRLLGRETGPKLYMRIPDDQVLVDGYSGTVLVPEESYFEIRLTEMYLHRRQQTWRGFIPLCLAVPEFLYDSGVEQVPFFVGNQIMKNLDAYMDGRFVEYRNTRVAGPIPYMGGDIGLFVGLFRVEVDNLIKGLFTLVETLAATFDVSQISSYLKLARPLAQELMPLLGMEEIGQRFAVRDELTGGSLKQGFLVYGNCARDAVPADTLWISRDGMLKRGASSQSLTPVDQFDYCVIQVRHRPQRDDLPRLPFYAAWISAREYLAQNDPDKAREKFTEMIRSIVVSADLTRKHRHELLLLYKTKFDQEKAVLAALGSTASVASRGTAVSRDAGVSLQRAAQVADRAGYDKTVWQGLMRLSRGWQQIPGLELADPEAEKAILDSQLSALRKITPIETPDPESLARVLTVTAYRDA